MPCRSYPAADLAANCVAACSAACHVITEALATCPQTRLQPSGMMAHQPGTLHVSRRKADMRLSKPTYLCLKFELTRKYAAALVTVASKGSARTAKVASLLPLFLLRF